MGLIAAIIALQIQTRYLDSAVDQYSQLTGVDWDSSIWKLSSKETLLVGICFLLIWIVYPFMFSFFPLDKPYLMRVSPNYGLELQLVLGIFIWTPAITLTTRGLLEGVQFSQRLRTNIMAVGTAVDPEENPQTVRGLLGYTPTWFFRTFQLLFFLWGLVGGIVVVIAFFARQELTIIVGVTLVVSGLLAYIYAVPLISLARWITERSHSIQTELRSQLVETQLQAVTYSFTDSDELPKQRKETTSVELQNAIESLPPTNPVHLLWEQLLRTVAGFLGPFATVAVKIFTAVQ